MINLFKKNSLFFLVFLISCAQNNQKIIEKTNDIFAKQKMLPQIYQTKNFTIFTAQKISDPKQDLRIYLEGDGKAYANDHGPSFDPTPTSYFLPNLIAQDNFANIIYIARPCQYITSQKCQEKYWTNARFAPEIIDAIDEILQNFPDKKLQLIGYSGGGAIAQYLAARHNNISNIRTIAGNLDHQKFCDIHAVPRLSGSLRSEENFYKLEKIPQIHFVGTKDKVVPPIIAQEYLEKLSQKNCTKIIEVEGAKHSLGWQEKWQGLLAMQPQCQ